jgi:hypothetical protein
MQAMLMSGVFRARSDRNALEVVLRLSGDAHPFTRRRRFAGPSSEAGGHSNTVIIAAQAA